MWLWKFFCYYGFAAIIAITTTVVADPHEHSLVECEGSQANITCPEGRYIQILLANYGRFSLLRCNPFNYVEKLDTQCHNPKTFDQLVTLCNGQTRCSIAVTDEFLGDPCSGTSKYLEVQFNCTGEPVATSTTSTTPSSTGKNENAVPDPSKTPKIGGEGDEKRNREQTDRPTAHRAHCAANENGRGLRWPKTEPGQIARIACPFGSEGFAEWQCSPEGVWSSEQADLSRCVNIWAKNLRIEAFSDANRDDPGAQLQTMKEIQKHTRTDEMYGGDVISISEALAVTAERFDRVGAGCLEEEDSAESTECRRRDARDEKVMSQLILESVNNLLAGQQKSAWSELTNKSKQFSSAAAVRLLDAVEKSATTLVGTFNENAPACEPLQRSSVVLEVSVVNIHGYVTFPSMSLYNDQIDSIEVPSEALVGKSGKNEMAKVVYAAYDNLGQHLNPGQTTSRDVSRQVVSRVLTTSIISQSRARTVSGLSRPVVINFRITKQSNHTNPICVWWDRAKDNWSPNGCNVKLHNASHVVCECDHLTHFAVLMDVKGQRPSLIHEISLTFLTYVGCTISICCLAISFLAFQFLSPGGNDRVCIHKNLCFCLMVANLIFVFGIWQTDDKLKCGIIAGAMQYFFLASFSWMLLEGVELYHMLVEVFNSVRSRKPLLYLIGYGFPALIVGLSVWADPTSFGTSQHCWLRTDNFMILAFIGPVVFVLIVNTVFLAMTMCIVCRHSRIGYTTCKHDADTMEEIRSCLRGAIVLLFLLGLTWSFGLLWVDEQTIGWAYAFTVLNSLQGMFIFLFHVAFNDRDYRKWLRTSSWLPMCMRSYALDDRKHNGAVYLPGSSSSSGGGGMISSPLPPLSSNCSAASELMYPVNEKRLMAVIDPRYNQAVQMQLARQGHYNTGMPEPGYDYITQVYGDCRPYAGHVNYHSQPFVDHSDPYQRHHASANAVYGLHRGPPPNFPPPPPPPTAAVGYGSYRGPDTHIANFQETHCQHPLLSPSSRFASCRPPSKLSSDDSAYSDGSSALFVYSPSSGGGSGGVLRMDLSRNPPVFVQDV